MHIHTHGKDKANPGMYYFVVHGTYEEFANETRPNYAIACEEAKLRYGVASPSVRRASPPQFIGRASEVSSRAPGMSENSQQPDGYLWSLPDHQVATMNPYTDKEFQKFCQERRQRDNGKATGLSQQDLMEQILWVIPT